LFWAYTFAFGIALLCLAVLSAFGPRILPAGARSTYRSSPHLHEPLKYRVDDGGMSVEGEALSGWASWQLLRTWQERNGWLILSSSGIPQVYLPTQDLKAGETYDRIMTVVRKHGKEFR